MLTLASIAPVLALFALVFGPLAGWTARFRGRNPVVWFVFGSLLGPVAVALLLVAPPGRCPRCEAGVSAWPRQCATCGMALTGALARPAEKHPSVAVTPAPVAARDDVVPADRPPKRSAARSSSSGATRARAARIESSTLLAAAPGSRPWTASSQRNGNGHDSGSGTGTRTTDGEVAPDLPETRPSRRRTKVAVADDSSPLIILATGVVVAASEHLLIGSRYAIARQGQHIRLLGPIETSPGAVAIDWPGDDVDATTADGRLLVSRTTSRDRRYVVFQAIAGMDPTLLAGQIRHPPTG